MKINLDALLEEWKIDAEIDKSRLDVEASKVPYLHAKYIELFSHAKLNTRNAINDCIRMKQKLIKYYKGLMSREELLENGWTQYQGKNPLKSELNDLVETHHAYVELETELHYRKTIEETLESIMKSIHSRTWDVKNNIEYLKFINGN